MNDKLDKVLDGLGNMIDTWIEEFKASPVRTTIKVLLIIYVIKKAKALLRDIR